jgi:hypothetical protein
LSSIRIVQSRRFNGKSAHSGSLQHERSTNLHVIIVGRFISGLRTADGYFLD